MNNYQKFATFNYPDTIPVTVGLYQPTWDRHGKALEELVLSHPNIFPGYKVSDYISHPPLIWQYELGRHTDHWGCEWNNLIEGHDSICIGHAVKSLSDVDALPIPSEDVGLEHGLMFLRLTFLRGYEECMIDFAEETPEFYKLIEKVITYNLRQVDLQLSKMSVDDWMISFGDDLGMQIGLPTGPEKWRKILKPCFTRLFKPCKSAGKLVFLHTDGCIHEIIPDLKDCGVDIINPQFRANGLENLKRVTRGTGRNRIAVHLDLDRQLFPFATPSELEDHIMECVEALALPEGGLSLYAEISEDVPLDNITSILNTLEKARVYFNNIYDKE